MKHCNKIHFIYNNIEEINANAEKNKKNDNINNDNDNQMDIEILDYEDRNKYKINSIKENEEKSNLFFDKKEKTEKNKETKSNILNLFKNTENRLSNINNGGLFGNSSFANKSSNGNLFRNNNSSNNRFLKIIPRMKIYYLEIIIVHYLKPMLIIMHYLEIQIMVKPLY